MLLHAYHEIGTLHALVVAGPVIHVGSGGHLPTNLYTGNNDRLKPGPRSIDCGGIPGRSGAKNK